MKKILFVIESLVCAGAEKSLVTLLNLMDYTKYEVDLQLFSYGGEFEELLPSNVNLLSALPYFKSSEKPIKSYVVNKTTKKEKQYLKSRLSYTAVLRTGKYNNPQKAVLFWKCSGKCFDIYEKEYDAAIAYAQGTPTFYVADCVKAKKKIAWINVTYQPTGKYRDFVSLKYNSYDKISCVSDSSYEIFEQVFPEHRNKGTVIYDINDGNLMERLSGIASDAKEDMKCGEWKLLTVGRLAAQKGYDIALEACRILKERGLNFTWYVLGRGPLENEIRDSIVQKNIEDNFILLGTRSNPYPYIKEADVYVQTSKFEGFGLAIAEARMLNVPVVTTRFDAVYAQMVDNENGLVVDMNAEAVADGVERMMNDSELRNHITEYLKTEKKGNVEEIEKFYDLIG